MDSNDANPRIIAMHEPLLDSSHESLYKSFLKFLCESSTDYRDKVLHYWQARLYLPTDWLLLHTQSGLLSSYYIERVEIEQRSRAAPPDTAPDQAAEFTPQRNRSTKQNPTKVSPKGNPKGESIGGSIWGSIWGSIGGSIFHKRIHRETHRLLGRMERGGGGGSTRYGFWSSSQI